MKTRKPPAVVPAPTIFGKPKFCVDCRFFEQGMGSAWCGHHPDYNLVDGREGKLIAGYERAVGACGPTAKNFEAKS